MTSRGDASRFLLHNWETTWAYQGTTTPAVSGPVAVGESTPKQLANTGLDGASLSALSVIALLALLAGIAGVAMARRRNI